MRLLLTATLLAGMTASSHAADAGLPMEQPPIGFNWTGGYVGAHAGYAWGDTNSNLVNILAQPSSLSSVDIDGGVVGGYIGYNFQADRFVFGIEADFDWTGISGGGSDVATIFIFNVPYSGSLDVDWQGSVRGRLGYAFDRLLVYGTGGLAYAHATVNASTLVLSAEDSKTHTGWTIGGGAEYAFTDNLISRLEYRYTDFSRETYNATTALGTDAADFGFDTNQVLLGLSYKF